jgi:hypothetical protein
VRRGEWGARGLLRAALVDSLPLGRARRPFPGPTWPSLPPESREIQASADRRAKRRSPCEHEGPLLCAGLRPTTETVAGTACEPRALGSALRPIQGRSAFRRSSHIPTSGKRCIQDSETEASESYRFEEPLLTPTRTNLPSKSSMFQNLPHDSCFLSLISFVRRFSPCPSAPLSHAPATA